MRTVVLIVAQLTWLWRMCGAEVVSPDDPGLPNSSGGEVFIVRNTFALSARAQQVFGASDFSNLGAPELLISDIRFGVSHDFMFEPLFLDNVQIRFSTTTRNPDGLSTTYAMNVGPDETLAYSGALAFGSTLSFQIHIHLQSPYLYDPKAGNLLMDIKNFVAAPPPRFPPNAAVLAYDIVGDTTSTVYGYDVNSPTASFSTSKGLDTVFTYTPVPEPSTVVLLLVGIALLSFAPLRTAKRRSTNMTQG
jgi:hypothetical protein